MNLTIGIFVAILSGCALTGDGKSISEARTLDAFNAIEADTSLDVVVTQGNVESVTVTTDSNLVGLVVTDVVGSTLRIRDTEAMNTSVPSVVTIVVPDLVAVDADGSGDIGVSGFSEPSMHLGNAGSGDLNASIHADALEVTLDGSGATTLEGDANALSLSLGGSGSLDGHALIGRGGSALDLSGSGSMRAELDDGTASIALSGSGSIHWAGSSEVVSQVRTGTGSIVHAP